MLLKKKKQLTETPQETKLGNSLTIAVKNGFLI